MRILDRYLIRELTGPFLVGIMVFTFVLLMSQFLRLVEMILNKGVGTGSALLLVGYLLPSILVMTVPMAVLLGTLVAFGRLSADNEITALKSGGVSILRLAYPAMLFAALAAGVTFVLITDTLPRANQAFRSLMFEIVRSKATLGLKERVFNADFDGLTMYIDRIPVGENPVMRGIIIHDSRGDTEQPRRDPVTIFANEGSLFNDTATGEMVFRLTDGSIHSLAKDRLRYQQIGFSQHDLRISILQGIDAAAALPKGMREMTIPELRNRESELRRQGLPPHPPRVEIHKKFALPSACFIFTLLGISLGVIFRKGEKMVAFALCVGVVIVYYIFLVAGEPLGKNGTLPPWLAIWWANIFFLALGLPLFALADLERVPTLNLLLRIRRANRTVKAGTAR